MTPTILPCETLGLLVSLSSNQTSTVTVDPTTPEKMGNPANKKRIDRHVAGYNRKRLSRR